MTDWLFDTLVATSGLLLLVLLIRSHVARAFGPSVAYWLWLLPAARLFMPALTKQIEASAVPAADIVEQASAAVPVTSAVLTSASAAEPSLTIDWTGLGFALWLGGAALLFVVQMIRYVGMRDELLADAVEIDRIGDIKVVQSDRIGGPLAFGLLRRYIAVPDHFTRTFSEEERGLALEHELAHHRSGDLYANLAAFMFLCLQWFNPLAWMAWNAFRFDQEAACDARVLAGSDTATRQSYGRALARSAADQPPTLAMAMALNSPSSLIQRLRRLMMKDTSKRRLFAGRTAIFAAAALALPLTATVVPVFADDKAPEDGKLEKHKTKVIIIKNKDGETHRIDVSGDDDTPFVKTIEKDGKTIVLRSHKELSDADVERMVAEAEESRAQAEAAMGDAEVARGAAEVARAQAEIHRIEAIKVINAIDIASMIPEIDIREIRGNCKNEGQPVTTDVQGFDGHGKSRVKVVICGKGQAKLARVQALQGLREARDDIEDDKDIPEKVRQSVLDKLDEQIDRMEDQQSEDEPDDQA